MPMDPTRLTRPQPQPQHEVWPRDLVKSAPASSLGGSSLAEDTRIEGMA